ARCGAQFVELHTGAYAEQVLSDGDVDSELARLKKAAELAHERGLGVNAGHGLTIANLPALLNAVPHLIELNIGHSLVSHALEVGLAASVQDFLKVMREYRLGPT